MKRHPLTLLSLLAALVAPALAQPVPTQPPSTVIDAREFGVRATRAGESPAFNVRAKLQAAIDAASVPGRPAIVVVPPVDLNFTDTTALVLPANFALVAQTPGSTRFIAQAGRTVPLITISAKGNVAIRGITLDHASGAALGGTAYGIYATGRCDGLLIEDVTTNGYVHGIHVAGDAGGTPNNAVFRVKVNGDATGGNWRLGLIDPTALGEALWTGDIAWNASAATVQTAINTAIGSGKLTVTGGPAPGSTLTLTATGTFAGLPVPIPLFTRGTLSGGGTNGVMVTASTAGGGPFAHNVTLRRVEVVNSPNDWGIQFDCIEGLNLTNVRSSLNYFDGVKFRKHVRGVHLSNCDFSFNGQGWFTNPATAAGDGFDSYAGGEEIDAVNVRCNFNAGNGFTIKNDSGASLSGFGSGKFGITRKLSLKNMEASYNLSNGANVTQSSGDTTYAVTDLDLQGRFEGNGAYGVFLEAIRAKVSGLARRNGQRGCMIGARSNGVDVTDLRAPANGNGAGTGYGLYIDGKNVTVKGGSFGGQDTDALTYATDPSALVKHHAANIQIGATAQDVRIERSVVAPEGTNFTGRSIQVASGATNVFIETSGTLTPGSNLLYGSPGSTYLKTDTGALYRKTSGAVDAVGTWRQQANALPVVSATIDFPSINAGASNTQSVTVTGAEVGDAVLVTPPVGFNSQLNVYGVVTSAGNIGVVSFNPTTGAIDPPSGSFTVVNFKN